MAEGGRRLLVVPAGLSGLFDWAIYRDVGDGQGDGADAESAHPDPRQAEPVIVLHLDAAARGKGKAGRLPHMVAPRQ